MEDRGYHHRRSWPPDSKGKGKGKGKGGKGKGGKGGYKGGAPEEWRNSTHTAKRARYEAAAVEEANVQRIREFIITNDGSEGHLLQLVDALGHDLEQYGDQVMSTVVECVCELPAKTTVYAALVGLLNLEHHTFVADLLQLAQRRFLQLLVDPLASRASAKLLLRFIGALVGVNAVQGNTFVNWLEAVLQAALGAAEAAAPGWQPYADHLVYLAMAALPWTGADLHDRDPEGLLGVLASCEAYVGKRARGVPEHARVLAGGGAGAGGEAAGAEDGADDFMEELWDAVHVLHQAASWTVQAIAKPHAPFEHQLSQGISHDLAPLVVPPMALLPSGRHLPAEIKVHQEWAYPGRANLRVIDAARTKGTRAPIEHFVVEEYVQDTLEKWEQDRAACVRELAELPVPSAWTTEYILAETICGQMLRLPRPRAPVVFYATVLVDLCRLENDLKEKELPNMAPALSATIGSLFRKIHNLDAECRERLAEWLALHLSNFSFHWPWERWEHVAAQPPHAPQRLFVHSVLSRLVSLAYWDRIAETLPPALHPLMPTKPLPIYRYAAVDAEGGDQQQMASESALAVELTGLFREKKPVGELVQWVRESVVGTVGEEGAVCTVGAAVLMLSSKSFTHLVTYLDRYSLLLKEVAHSRALQQTLVDVAADTWQSSAQHLCLVVERLMASCLVDNQAIINWAVQRWADLLATPSAPPSLSFLWDIFTIAVNKTIARQADLEAGVAAARADLAAAQRREAEAREHHAKCAEEISDQRALAEVERLETMLEHMEKETAQAQAEISKREAKALEGEAAVHDVLEHALKTFAGRVSQEMSSPGPGGAADSGAAEQREALVEWALSQLRVMLRHYRKELIPVMSVFEDDLEFMGDLHDSVRRLLQKWLQV